MTRWKKEVLRRLNLTKAAGVFYLLTVQAKDCPGLFEKRVAARNRLSDADWLSLIAAPLED